MQEHPRRRVLQTLGGLVAGSLAGCQTDVERPSDGGSTTSTPSASPTASRSPGHTPTEPPTPTERATTESPTDEPLATLAWTVGDLDGRVEELRLGNGPRSAGSNGGALYAGTTGGEVASIGTGSGDVRWRFAAAAAPGSRGDPIVRRAGSMVLVVSGTRNEETLRDYVEALDPETGDLRWSFEAREFLSPLGVVDGTLYLAGHYIRAPPSELGPEEDPAGEGRLHAVDAASGDELWRTTVPLLRGAAVASHGLYALEEESEERMSRNVLRAYDRGDGRERWDVETGGLHLPRPTTTAEGVLAAGEDGTAASYAPDGTRQWSAGAWELGPSEIEVAADRVFVGWNPLVAVSREGTELWRLSDGGRIVRSWPDDRLFDTLYVDRGTRVGAVEPDSGTRRWSWSPGSETYVHVQATIDGGLVVDRGVGLTSEFLLLDERSGDVVGDFSTPTNFRSAVATGSRVFAGSTGAVYAMDVDH